jgi:hypothetical protein
VAACQDRIVLARAAASVNIGNAPGFAPVTLLSGKALLQKNFRRIEAPMHSLSVRNAG